jgi:hypothetical protein
MPGVVNGSIITQAPVYCQERRSVVANDPDRRIFEPDLEQTTRVRQPTFPGVLYPGITSLKFFELGEISRSTAEYFIEFRSWIGSEPLLPAIFACKHNMLWNSVCLARCLLTNTFKDHDRFHLDGRT